MESMVLVSQFGGFRVPICTSSSPSEKPGMSRAKTRKYSVDSLDEAFKEVVSRVQEIKCAFGTNSLEHFCVQIKDYVTAIMEREKTRLKYQRTSPQRTARGTMIKLLMHIAEGEELTRTTLHLGVYLYDRFSDSHAIPVTQLWLVALCCLVIAGKLEERDTKTPKVKKLRDYLPAPAAEFRTRLFVQMEKYILDYFKWSLLIPNAYTFAQFYVIFIIDSLEEPIVPLDNTLEGKVKSSYLGALQDESFSSRNVNAVRFFAIEVLDTLLCDEPDDSYSPSLVAAATLMYARRRYGYSEWTLRLEFLTTYSKGQVLLCCDNYVKRVYEAQAYKVSLA